MPFILNKLVDNELGLVDPNPRPDGKMRMYSGLYGTYLDACKNLPNENDFEISYFDWIGLAKVSFSNMAPWKKTLIFDSDFLED